MGITDRSDPQQSIIRWRALSARGGEEDPERIQEPNRLWLTLAGYNIGFGHLEDARILTERDGASPDLWFEVKQRLPLLADKAYYKTLKPRLCTWTEPVDYVDRINSL